MPHLISVETPFESLVVEQALAFAREMEAAVHGKVLDPCELLTLLKGRELLRAILTGAAQQQADALEKKKGLPIPVNAVRRAGTKAARREPSVEGGECQQNGGVVLSELQQPVGRLLNAAARKPKSLGAPNRPGICND